MSVTVEPDATMMAVATGVANAKAKVAVVYTHFPHYRKAVFNELRRSDRYDYKLYYDEAGIDSTIRSAASLIDDVHLRTFTAGRLMFQPGFLRHIFERQFDAFIFLGNPYVVSTWFYALVLVLRGKKVAFWTHGWNRSNEGAKGAIRSAFYRLADALLLYGDRARAIGAEKGFAPERLWVIYNSLDYEAQRSARDRQQGSSPEINGRYFLCVSRLVPEVELDLAIEAIATLRDGLAPDAKLVIVGSGPDRERLAALSACRAAPIILLGPIYDEERLAGLFMNCLAVVSPGKVGLLAMHAMAYGAPVITHDNFDQQMPEAEALTRVSQNRFFAKGDVSSLCAAMGIYLERGYATVESDRSAAIRLIEAYYHPRTQRRLIENALDAMLHSDNLK
jgi:glycosyltransferase involved in cell wall biosynthesis